MTTTAFPAARINRLRASAAEARRLPDDVPEGWSKSEVDPAAVVSAFRNLQVKPGYVLRAYQFREGGNGNGIVWAMPTRSDFPETDQCPKLSDRFLSPPRPPDAADDLMEVIDGDGSPFSYLCASVLQRELLEFGAIWHGCNWSTHDILGSDPFGHRSRRILPPDPPVIPMEAWHWTEFCPARWRPRVEHHASGTVIVTFLSFSALGGQKLVRHIDTFTAESYRFTSDEKVVATAPGGYVF